MMNKISIIQIIAVAILAAAVTDSMSISEDYEYNYETGFVTNKQERMVEKEMPRQYSRVLKPKKAKSKYSITCKEGGRMMLTFVLI
jgi:hypothetical protein